MTTKEKKQKRSSDPFADLVAMRADTTRLATLNTELSDEIRVLRAALISARKENT